MLLTDFPDIPDAECARTGDPELWFAHDVLGVHEAKAICRRCPGMRACLAWALTHQEHGVWAGTTAAQRQELLARHTKEHT